MPGRINNLFSRYHESMWLPLAAGFVFLAVILPFRPEAETPSWIIGVCALVVAWSQVLLNKQKLRFDLFRLRMDIYQRLERLLQVIHNGIEGDEKSRYKVFYTLRKLADEAGFLFDSDIIEWLEELKELCGSDEIFAFQEELAGMPQGKERNALVKKHREKLDRLENEITGMKGRFASYLSFTKP